MPRLTRAYMSSLRWIIGHPWWTGLGIVHDLRGRRAAADAPARQFRHVSAGRRPAALHALSHRGPALRWNASRQRSTRIEEYLFSRQEEFNIRSVYSYFDQGQAQSTLLLTEEEEATLSTKEIIETHRGGPADDCHRQADLPVRPAGWWRRIQVQISGDSTELLNELGDEVARACPPSRDSRTCAPTPSRARTRCVSSIDRDRAAIGRPDGRGHRANDRHCHAWRKPARISRCRSARSKSGSRSGRTTNRVSSSLPDLPLYTPDGNRITLGSVATLHVGQVAGNDSAYRQANRRNPVRQSRRRASEPRTSGPTSRASWTR